jgi:hypothetical protein
MSKPIVHARSSAKKWGGEPSDYLPVHDLMDSSKAVLADNRHRALTHHSWFGFSVEQALGHTLTTSCGRVVSVRDLVEQHCLEDYSNKAIPTAADYLIELPLAQWMSSGIDNDFADRHAADSAAVFGGDPDAYLGVHRLLNRSQAAFHDARHRALTHHSFFIDLIEQIVGESLITSAGSVPTRLVAERHIISDFGRLLCAQDWLEDMRFADWFNNAVLDCPPSARAVMRRRAATPPGKIFTFNLD